MNTLQVTVSRKKKLHHLQVTVPGSRWQIPIPVASIYTEWNESQVTVSQKKLLTVYKWLFLPGEMNSPQVTDLTVYKWHFQVTDPKINSPAFLKENYVDRSKYDFAFIYKWTFSGDMENSPQVTGADPKITFPPFVRASKRIQKKKTFNRLHRIVSRVGILTQPNGWQVPNINYTVSTPSVCDKF